MYSIFFRQLIAVIMYISSAHTLYMQELPYMELGDPAGCRTMSLRPNTTESLHAASRDMQRQINPISFHHFISGSILTSRFLHVFAIISWIQ